MTDPQQDTVSGHTGRDYRVPLDDITVQQMTPEGARARAGQFWDEELNCDSRLVPESPTPAEPK